MREGRNRSGPGRDEGKSGLYVSGKGRAGGDGGTGEAGALPSLWGARRKASCERIVSVIRRAEPPIIGFQDSTPNPGLIRACIWRMEKKATAANLLAVLLSLGCLPKEVPCPPPPPPPPKVTPCPPPPGKHGCPIDTLKLDACVDILGGLVHIGIGPSASEACCPVLSGLADLDAAVCLCTTLRAKLLNIKLILPIALKLLVDSCGKHVPSDFQCPSY
ncbi:hypothetical protein Taro_046510 [Colocasia esculenta]|uniref:Bifunctional inhibitor/plant lipid transfer protein/seed storage helical domain-containing protein n=1 Tax=Colocasia esculenta TaxID=4460 RepID=A0A843X486_COLES|nr:hypothetical protein [Colocasia esculenta]